jgi:hypothetical protein
MTGASWPQPYEGIRGEDRDDWLLSLDERAVAHREALIAMAAHLRTATLVGQPAPVVRRISDRINAPQPGDLAVTVEVLAGRRDPDDRLTGFGIYLAGRREWAATDAQWQAFCAQEAAVSSDPGTLELICSDDNRATDSVFYLQYGPAAGDICRWHNSEAVVLPVLTGSFSADAAAERTGTAAVFTRDSLTGGLADSGFTLRDPRDRGNPDGTP